LSDTVIDWHSGMAHESLLIAKYFASKIQTVLCA